MIAKGPGAKSGYEGWSQGSRNQERQGEVRPQIEGDELGAS